MNNTNPTITARYKGFQRDMFGPGTHEYAVIRTSWPDPELLGTFSITGEEDKQPSDMEVAIKMKEVLM